MIFLGIAKAKNKLSCSWFIFFCKNYKALFLRYS